jgi:hypothetical protein
MRHLWFILLLLIGGWSGWAWADTHTVTTCSSTNISAAITDANAGDDVYLDCSTGTIASPVTVNKSITLHGRTADYKGGSSATVLTMTSTLTISLSGTVSVVVKDLKLTGTVSGGFFLINGTMDGYRVTNVWFETGQYAISTTGYQLGVFDNCRFTSIGSYAAVQFHVQEGNTSGAFARASSLGTRNALFIEDSIILGSVAGIEWIMSQGGQGYVFRYNDITNYTLDVHGYCSGSPVAGTREFEIYKNTWRATVNYNESATRIRGGTGMVHNNTYVSNGNTIAVGDMWLQEIYQPSMCSWSTCCATNPTTGYCVHAVGRGQNDTLQPLYWWRNLKDGSNSAVGLWPTTSGCSVSPGNGLAMADYIKANRDYYDGSTATGNPQTVGVRTGTKATMQALGCTAGVGFWVTDEGYWDSKTPHTAAGVLYKCTATNTWTLSYVPYTYPHPLRSGLASPTGVSAP